MGYMYYCPRCRSTYSAEKDNQQYESCPTCNIKVIPMHLTTDWWHTQTDEKKEEIKKQFDSQAKLSTSQTSSNSNSIGQVLRVVGFIYIAVSIIGALVIMSEELIGGIIAGIFGCLGGLLLMGFSEIINLLQDIKNK